MLIAYNEKSEKTPSLRDWLLKVWDVMFMGKVTPVAQWRMGNLNAISFCSVLLVFPPTME